MGPSPACKHAKVSRASAENSPNVYWPILLCSLCSLVIGATVLSGLSLRPVKFTSKAGPASMQASPTSTHLHRLRPGMTRVAILADTALTNASRRVLRLVRQEQADMVLHQGDLDYTGDAAAWERQIDAELGADFPYFFSMGNYEAKDPSVRGKAAFGAGVNTVWPRYDELQRARLERLGVRCPLVSKDGQRACCYKGVCFVLSSIGIRYTSLSADLGFLRDAIQTLRAESKAGMMAWRFCSWHLPLLPLQVSFRDVIPSQRSAALVEAYDLCREEGYAVITGHEHYYVRSSTVYNFSLSSMQHAANTRVVHVGRGSTFVVGNGLGGHSLSVPSANYFRERTALAVVHPSSRLVESDPHGKVFFRGLTGTPHTTSGVLLEDAPDEADVPFGVLFCDLPTGPGAQLRAKRRGAGARCSMKTISGEIVDSFVIKQL